MKVFSYILVKLASRCNIKCDYCYWFRDSSVSELSAIMSPEVENTLIERVAEHVSTFGLANFSVLLHGGEPLLFGKKRMVSLLYNLHSVCSNLGCKLDVAITTNGMLLDDEWLEILKAFQVSITISLDGPKAVNDAHRIDHKGRGTFDRVMASVDRLRVANVDHGTLAVCDPDVDPDEVYSFFKSNGFRHFDVLIPDATHDDDVPSIAPFYKKLFDRWYEDRFSGIDIRILQGFLRGLLGATSLMEGLGGDPIDKCIVNVDGRLEPLDVLRIAGSDVVQTKTTIFANAIQDVASDPVWTAAYDASLNLHSKCVACEFRSSCGGGYLPHRWSNDARYDNPNVYCSDMIDILRHVRQKITINTSRTEGLS